MKNSFFTLILLFLATMGFGQTQFKIKFSNQRNEMDVKVNFKVLKDDNTIVSKDSIVVSARSSSEKIIRVRNNQKLEVFPSSGNNLFLQVTRTNAELKSNQIIDGNPPTNVNIVQLENLKNSTIEVAQLMEELNTSGILRKLLDTTDLIIDKKIRIGSFLIYNETDKKYVEVFEPTLNWYDRKNVEIFNGNNETFFKTTTKNSLANAGINIPEVIKLGGQKASSNYFDFRWRVYNFREEKFGVTTETPQTLFKKYPEHTGYNLFKSLLQSNNGKKYKIYFVTSWSLTDSIATFVDSYVGVDKKIELDFNYPPNGVKVFGIDGKAAFQRANSEFRASVKQNLYNYFEISDITASAYQFVEDEFSATEENRREQIRQLQINSLNERRSKNENEIKSVYKTIVDLDNRYICTDDINIILQVPFFKKTIRDIPDTLSIEIKESLERQNFQNNTLNTLIDYISRRISDYAELVPSIQELYIVKEKALAIRRQVEEPIDTRKLDVNELIILSEFGKK
jgi:hypothetical protein